MKIYIKGYYGYQNIGDEILLLGVLSYATEKYRATKVIIESGDKERLSLWIKKNQTLISSDCEIVCIEKNIIQRIGNAIQSFCGVFPFVILGGGEVINNQLSWPRNGRHYIMQYPGILFGIQKYALYGGFDIPKKKNRRYTKVIFRWAREVVCRDKISYQSASSLSSENVTLYHDRAYDVLEIIKPKKSPKKGNYVLLNIHPYIVQKNPKIRNEVCLRIEENSDRDVYFVLGDIGQDQEAYDRIREKYPRIILWKRTGYSIEEILDFFAGADCVGASRLHLLLLFQYVGHKNMKIRSYHSKIRKVLDI